MSRINRFIDLHPGTGRYDPEWHDANRIIIDGHWLPQPLLYLAIFIYEHFQRSCLHLKAALHHHIVDYLYTVISSGKYDWELKDIVRVSRAIVGDKVYEEDNPEVVCVGSYARKIANTFAVKVLRNIVENFEHLLNLDENALLEL